MPKKKTIEEINESFQIEIMGRFTGKLKSLIAKDIQRGVKGADLLRDMAKLYYSNKNLY